MNASKSGVIITNIIANGQPNCKIKVVREPESYKDMVIPCQVLKCVKNYEILYFGKGVTTKERALTNAIEYCTTEISTVGSSLTC